MNFPSCAKHALIPLQAAKLAFYLTSCNDFVRMEPAFALLMFFFCASKATGQLYRLPRQPKAKLPSLGVETAAAASGTEVFQDGSLMFNTESTASKSDSARCSIQ